MTSKVALSALVGFTLIATPTHVFSDEGGVSYWLPGQMGSLAAVPGESGWSLPLIYVHSDAGASADRNFARGGRLVAGIDGRADLVLFIPTYTFVQPLWGGQASAGVGIGGGRMKAGVNATIASANGAVLSGSESDTLDGVADLYPTASVKWNHGVHNTMVYAAAGVPVGSYARGRLANIGVNHWSLDAGGGYTYFDTKTGLEFSAVAGLTYNFENRDTDYRNGVDGHIDWAASYFFSPRSHAGLVGYFYHQLTGDSGSGAQLGDFKSRVNAIGPQIGWFLENGGRKYYVNVKGYQEWGARNRAEGWSAWLSLVIPLSGN